MNTGLLKGILLVVAGAVSYAVLAIIVRFAYNEGYTTIEVITSQYTLGLAVLGAVTLLKRKAPGPAATPAGRYVRWQLAAGGVAYGLTGVCYYMAVKYIPVSICVVLLMQTIWMGIVLEALLRRQFPGWGRCLAVLTVLAGTLLATNAIRNGHALDARGIAWGLAAAVTYTIMLFVSNRVALNMSPYEKGCWTLAGATALVLLIGAGQFGGGFNVSIFWKWGLLLSLFGTILPPVLFNTGMPKTGIGLGSILISAEIPVSVSMAYLLLHETVLASQWLGIVLIITAIVLINFNVLRKEFKTAASCS
ncbi:EamA family transporter [Chitinophaga japonensis]|uniref:Threonine/homoserine efflux transporter RhtA n=1 Tax=Chitinophaga japonensis TaxID=104662 RepID=A0A562TF24_CHIJA|nr:DMT family transporter [Chitinophaga japonensis]TWI92085.1 threonine/homoserine efflux transporter RhtA [Chitinophaga japonensis]